jgi:hypothetical protein
MTLQGTPPAKKGPLMFQNMRFIKLLTIFIIVSAGRYLLRGVPQDEIPYPDTANYGDELTGYSARPIPYNVILLAYRTWFNLKIIIYNNLNNVLLDHEFDSLYFEAINQPGPAD